MADKEERQKRLLIKEYDLVCDLADCEYCEEKDWCSEKDGMTRQEAIERMAKAMCHSPFESCEGCIVQKKKQACKQALEGMKELAEAALNSLLGVEKKHSEQSGRGIYGF